MAGRATLGAADHAALLSLIAQGSRNSDIGSFWGGVPLDTVKSRVRSLLAYLRCLDRTHAVLAGMQHGLIELRDGQLHVLDVDGEFRPSVVVDAAYAASSAVPRPKRRWPEEPVNL